MKKLLFSLLAGVTTLFGCSSGSQKESAVNNDTTSVNHPAWTRNAVIYEVNTRQYTREGSFRAFANHIPRLRELGVDILWFKAVNPEFGTIDDFKAVVDSAHAAGMKVIIDWVPNHTGCDNAWVSDHPERYELDEKGEMFGPYDWTDVFKLDYSKPDTRAAMIDAMQFWLRETDIDGFRCDVAGNVPVDFWNEARPALESVKSDIFMLAEAAMPELNREAFDMSYNWPLSNVFSAIAATAGQYGFIAPGQTEPNKFAETHAMAIDSLFADQALAYPVDSYMMNMITNHDYNSWEGTEFDRLGQLVPAFAVLTYTLPGMPLIYTGQEVGMNRAFEFFEKDDAPDWNTDNGYTAFYTGLNNLKHSRPELAAGENGGKLVVYPATDEDVFVFSRAVGESRTLVGVNLGSKPAVLDFKKERPEAGGFVDAMNGQSVDSLPGSLAPGEYFVFTK